MKLYSYSSSLFAGFILCLATLFSQGCEAPQNPSNINKTTNTNNSNLTATTAMIGNRLDEKMMDTPIFGITTDTLPYKNKEFKDLTDRIDAVKLSSGRRPLVRINIDADDRADLVHYENSVQKLKDHAGVMVNLIDSHDMYSFSSVETYRQMVQTYLNKLGKIVDVWEIGNEVNGEWVGWKTDKSGNVIMDDGRKIPIRDMDDKLMGPKRTLVSQQIAGAYQEVLDYEKRTGTDLKTALTLYYNDDQEKNKCWEKPEYEMFAWAGAYIDGPIKKDLDYVFLSFYEDKNDCPILKNNPALDAQTWVKIFNQVSGVFGSANPEKGKLGFGEFGPQCYDCEDSRTCGSCKKAKLDFIPRYYITYHQALIKAKVPKYIGGFFYWYFYQDMVQNKDKEVWTKLESVTKSY